MYQMSSRPREFIINNYLKLRLEQGRTIIYVKNRPFKQCMYLLMNIQTDRIPEYGEIRSIDEAAEKLDRSLEGNHTNRITSEAEFWGHCSNIQAWAENDYDTRILHRNLAFPLLKKLTEVGDPIALQKFKEEIAIRYASGHPTVMTFLTQNGYMRYLNAEELECLLDDKNLPILDGIANDFNGLLETLEGSLLGRRLVSLVNGLSKNFGMHNIAFIISQVIKAIPEESKQFLVHAIYKSFQKKKNFPMLQFLNSNIHYFKKIGIELVKYNDRIIALVQSKILDLRNQNIKDIENINGLNKYFDIIEELDLSSNQIEKITGLGKFTHLKSLKLANNQIKKFCGLEELNNLEILIVRNNNLSNIKALVGLTKLKYLDLSGNHNITEIPEFFNDLNELNTLKLENCGIIKFSNSIARFFWMGQNYRFYKGYSNGDVKYYERTHKRKAASNGQLYKHFVVWQIKLKKLMIENKINHKDIEIFEMSTGKNAIWNGKLTFDFKKWLFYKPQTKITSFL